MELVYGNSVSEKKRNYAVGLEDRMLNQSAANLSPRRKVAQLLLHLPDEVQIGPTLAQI
jgi:hypothetical protein